MLTDFIFFKKEDII